MNDKFNEIKRLEILLGYANTLLTALSDLTDFIAKELQQIKFQTNEEIRNLSDEFRTDPDNYDGYPNETRKHENNS